MRKSCIKIKTVRSDSELHNTRKKKPRYLIKAERENVSIERDKKTIAERQKEIRKMVKEKTGRAMQKKAAPIREAVILLEDSDNDKNIKNLLQLTNEIEKKYGIQAFQWHIHNDEGHVDKDGNAKYNYHAHVLFDWMNHKTGKSIKLERADYSNIQTMTAQSLEMIRGEKGSKNLSLNHHEYRNFLQIREELGLMNKVEMTREQERELRERILKEKIEKQQQNEITQRNRGGIGR